MQMNASKEKKPVGGGKEGKQIYREKMKFLPAQHNEEMAGHGFAPNLLEKPDLKIHVK